MIYAITLCFNRADVIERSLNQYLATRNPGLSYRHVLVDNCYPLQERETSEFLTSYANKNDMLLLHPGKNLGLHGGWNWACSKLDLKPDDILIGYDPDSWPLSLGWDMALVRALLSDERRAWASLMSPRAKPELEARGYIETSADGHIRLWQTRSAVVNSICAWRWSFLEKAGGLQEPTGFYGGLEISMWDKLQKQRKSWVFTTDYAEDDRLRHETDRDYTVYKWVHAHLRSWPGDFKSWLAAGKPNPEDSAPLKLP